MMQVIMMALLAADTMACKQQVEFKLTSEGKLTMRKHLTHYSDCKGYLQTAKIDENSEAMLRLQRILAEQPQGFLTKDDSMQFIVDSGATNMATFDEKDFKTGTLRRFKPGE